MSTSRANSFIKKVLYQLKKSNSQLVDLYIRGTVSVDTSTGKSIVPDSRWRIKKAIMLPIEALRNFTEAPPFATAGRQFEYGAFYGTGASSLIIDTKDLPNSYIYNLDDAFIIKHRRFQIKKTQEFQDLQSAIFIIEELKGQRVNEAWEVKQFAQFTDGATLG